MKIEKWKRCTKCGETKHPSEFYKHRITKDGLTHQCKECQKNKYKKYLKTPSGTYTNIKARVKHFKNKTFNISREDFIEWYNEQIKVCVYCNIKEEDLSKLNDSIISHANRLTVDCVENELGYVGGNLALACMRCNYLKNDFLSFREMREIGQKYVKPKWEGQLGCW